MESDILVEGFRQAEKTHGVRYMPLIDDQACDHSVVADEYGLHVVEYRCPYSVRDITVEEVFRLPSNTHTRAVSA